MNTDQVRNREEETYTSITKHVELTRRIIAVFYEVYNELGYGFLESVYLEAMRLALTDAGLHVGVEVAIPVTFRGRVVGVFRADAIVNGVVLTELKALEQIGRQQESQILHYLRATDIEVGLLMNFGPVARFKRFVMDNELKISKRKSVQSAPIGVKSFNDIEPMTAAGMTP